MNLLREKIVNNEAVVVQADKSISTVNLSKKLGNEINNHFEENRFIEKHCRIKKYNNMLEHVLSNSSVIHPAKSKTLGQNAQRWHFDLANN